MLDLTQRNNIIANRVAKILGGLTFLLLSILVTLFGPNVNTPIILGIGVFFFGIGYSITHGFPKSGKILLCLVPAVLTLIAAILAKLNSSTFTDILYYDARFILVLLGIVPCLIFNTTERLSLYGSLFMIILILMLFDPLHEMYNVGYFQRGFESTSYYYINYVCFLTFFGIVTGALSLKFVMEKTERENILANDKLSEAFRSVEAQNEEISAQKEELSENQRLLLSANDLIEKQKTELQHQVNEVNANLKKVNAELVKQNSELMQFSYTISHNLRGPIARLLGLTHLSEMSGSAYVDKETGTIMNHIKTSAEDLDKIITDLNKVIDNRNAVQKKQHVEFIHEFDEVQKLLNISEKMKRENFHIDFSEAPAIYTVKAILNSILYNLISNAIKFRSTKQKLLVSVTSFKKDDYVGIQVEDNGLGIDMALFKQDLFKMYKRFHNHLEGKGLGLYLIKSQAESLNGFVEVTSEPNVGTAFRVFIKDSQEVS